MKKQFFSYLGAEMVFIYNDRRSFLTWEVGMDSFFHEQESYEVLTPSALSNVIFYTNVDRGSYVPPHWHDALELVYVEEGSLDFYTMGKLQHLHAHELVIVNPGEVHGTKTTGNKAVVFQIPSTFLQMYLRNFYSIRFAIDIRNENPIYRTKVEQFCMQIEKMQFFHDRGEDGDALMFSSLLFDILYRLWHNFSFHVTDQQAKMSRKNMDRMQQIFSYVNGHYKEQISLENVAAEVGLEKGYFCKFFKKMMHETFYNYLVDVRIGRIYQDLIQTDRPVLELMEENGFTSYKTFHKAFLDRFHMTPSEIRKNVQQMVDEENRPISQRQFANRIWENEQTEYLWQCQET